MRGKDLWRVGVCASFLAAGVAPGEVPRELAASDLSAEVEIVDLDAPDGAALHPALARAQELKRRHLAELTAGGGRRAGAVKQAKQVVVDCAKGESVQAAIDKGSPPLVVEVRGVCHENVSLRGKEVTLRGIDPATDGIQGVETTPPALAALTVFYVDGAAIENLSISGGPAIGVATWFSHVTMTNVRVVGNGATGVHVSSSSLLAASASTVSQNGGHGINVQRGGTLAGSALTVAENALRGITVSSPTFNSCTGCTVTGNGRFAGGSSQGGVLTFLDSVVGGGDGLVSNLGGYVDIDCVSAGTGQPCGLTASRFAVVAFLGGHAALFAAGDFSGSVLADDRGHVFYFGARQLAGENIVTAFGTLWATPFQAAPGVFHQSHLGETHVDGFARALLDGETVVEGDIHCDRAGDVWLDPGVVVTPGTTIDGCEHAPPPGP